MIRKLIDRIVLTPIEDEHGHKTLSIDLHGPSGRHPVIGHKSKEAARAASLLSL